MTVKEPGKGIYSESVGDVHICKEAVPLDKIKKRDMKLSDYNISRAKYNELKYFCMQYAEKKRELEKGYGLNAIVNDGMPKGNMSGNPVERAAIHNTMLRADIELIEQTAIEADSEIYPWILKNVTDGLPYEYMDVPINRTDFYCIRKYFFYLLSLKR
ncbi:hypothetical protein [Enterocloster sp.]|uniref:hypothetical protein n=1 Tax=Enterocloster sp. TaxID=2719315 RepID=UPI003AF529E0